MRNRLIAGVVCILGASFFANAVLVYYATSEPLQIEASYTSEDR